MPDAAAGRLHEHGRVGEQMGERLIGADHPAELAALTGVSHRQLQRPLASAPADRLRARSWRARRAGRPPASQTRVPSDLARLPSRRRPRGCGQTGRRARLRRGCRRSTPQRRREPVCRAGGVERDVRSLGSGDSREVGAQQQAVAHGPRRERRQLGLRARGGEQSRRQHALADVGQPALAPPAKLLRDQSRLPSAAAGPSEAQQTRARPRRSTRPATAPGWAEGRDAR